MARKTTWMINKCGIFCRTPPCRRSYPFEDRTLQNTKVKT
jgi:hypothetical protein